MEGFETTFILKDVIYIVVGVASALGFYWKMVMSDKSQDQKINQMKKDIDKNENVMFKKFSGIHTRMEKSEEKNKTELDTINKELAEVKIGISSINGKLDILIKNNNL
jgi:preprotein translocase subunit YajC